MLRPLKRVVLLGDRRKPGVVEAVGSVERWIEGRAELVAVDLDESLDFRNVAADLVVIFGGDGSILATARRMGARPIPTIGVNFGKFGFLTDIRARDVLEELGRVIDGHGRVEERMMLVGRLDGAEAAGEFHALNEFFLGPASVGKVVTLSLFIDGDYATTYRGDGLVVATPTGSTGHSLSAGGPIVDPALAAIILTPVSPHSLTNRPLVVPPGTEVKVRAVTEHAETKTTFSADGQVTAGLLPDEVATIRCSERKFPLVRTGLRGRYDVLRTQLGWSGRPPYEADQWESEGT